MAQNALITNFNPILPNLQKIINSQLNILYSDPEMKKKFPPGSLKTIYRRNPNLKEILSPSRFPKRKPDNKLVKQFCNRCDICNHYLDKSSQFRCTATGTNYNIKGKISCSSYYAIYLITCKDCKKQYIGSTEKFKPRFRGHKSDNNKNNQRCGAAKHFNGSCKHPELGPNGNMKVQIIQCIPPPHNDENLLKYEQYWQAQLFTFSHGLNSKEDWYSAKRKGYRRDLTG